LLGPLRFAAAGCAGGGRPFTAPVGGMQGGEAMINQDEVFVITEDDILKPADKKGKTGSQGRSSGAASKAAKGDRGRETEETMMDHTPPPRGRRARAGNPAAAGTLSLLVWGLGQFYNGDSKLGALFLLGEIQVIAFHYLMIKTWGQFLAFAHRVSFVNEWELMLYVSSVDFCLIFFMIYNVAQAYHAAEARSGRFEGLHRPLVAGMASLIVPGWGQMLNGQPGKAKLFLFAFLLQLYMLALYFVSPFYQVISELQPQQIPMKRAIWIGMAGLFATALSWLVSTYDAFLVARYTRKLTT
jgi:TM2 domain-containing membrane protein YozV